MTSRARIVLFSKLFFGMISFHFSIWLFSMVPWIKCLPMITSEYTVSAGCQTYQTCSLKNVINKELKLFFSCYSEFCSYHVSIRLFPWFLGLIVYLWQKINVKHNCLCMIACDYTVTCIYPQPIAAQPPPPNLRW